MKRYTLLSALLVSLLVCSSAYSQIDTKDTKMMTQPAISKNHIAFIYANDLWIADIDGKNPKRLTIDEGIESSPHFSPDGSIIAFSASYDGNADVYTIPVEGGIPKRLTFHPQWDIVRDFTPDGKSVLFVSPRKDFSRRHTKLFQVPLEGGFPTELPIPFANHASYYQDGSMIAYNPNRDAFRQWKNYRGGTVSTVSIYKFNDKSVEKIPQPRDFCNDAEPVWIGNNIYFISDRNGEFNLFSFNFISKEIKQLTNFKDFPVQHISAGNGKIIMEQNGSLYVYSPAENKIEKLTIGISTDVLSVRPRFLKGLNYLRNGNISPSGARAVFEIRGEIFTVPAEKGDVRNITNSTNANDRSPVWSPDGKTIAYFSDESGEYQLVLASQDGKGEKKSYKLGGAGFYSNPKWSPDSKKISYSDNSSTLYYFDTESGKTKKVMQDVVYNLFDNLKGVWSPDSKWIVFTKLLKNYIQQAYLYSIENEKAYPVTDGMSDVSDPVFDKSGKYLYFFGSTDAGPVKEWFDQSTADMNMSRSIYLTVLSKDSASPLLKESDEEKGTEPKADPAAESAKDKKGKKDKKDKDEKADKPKTDVTVNIDIENINFRILALPISPGNYYNLQTGKEGEIYYLEAPTSKDGMPSPTLHMFDLKKRKEETVSSSVGDYDISSDKSKVLWTSNRSWYISALSPKLDPSQGRLNMESIQVFIDPVVEWKQILNEVWRINRDYFYDPNMHGADWNAIKEKYSAFLPHLTCRSDLNRVIAWMCSELGVGHSYSGGGDDFIDKPYIPVGLLGADYKIENGRYRFERVIGGLNWTPVLRAPLTEPGVNVKAGEYLLAVDGVELNANQELYTSFQNKAGKITEIKVGPNPDGKDSRTVMVVPISDESTLRHFDWVEGNIKKVDEASKGQIAYVYVPNTAMEGHTYFKRYFFPQTNKKAIIIDERFNGGGLIPDYYIDILKRPYTASNTTRYGEDTKIPGASIQGPKVMLIDEEAGSGGDMLPWMFKKFKMGTLVGKRTWGGLVGILGFPDLMDGGMVTAPNAGLWAETGWICENVGVAPDIEVEQLPSDIQAGKDPQLEKAIEIIMEELKNNPPVEPARPQFPIKVRR